MVTKFAIAQHRAEWATKPEPLILETCLIRSDNASDYNSTGFLLSTLIADTAEVTGGVSIVSHSHSIGGEGKAVNDMKNGQISQVFRRSIPSYHNITCLDGVMLPVIEL